MYKKTKPYIKISLVEMTLFRSAIITSESKRVMRSKRSAGRPKIGNAQFNRPSKPQGEIFGVHFLFKYRYHIKLNIGVSYSVESTFDIRTKVYKFNAYVLNRHQYFLKKWYTFCNRHFLVSS